MTGHLLTDHDRHGIHDRRAAALKGKAASPWRRGIPWLSGGGTRRPRMHIAAERQRIERENYPDALRRPAIFVPYPNRGRAAK